MNYLEERIKKEGRVLDGNVLKVDGFLNHRIDIDLLRQIACDFRRRFDGCKITKILTIESSGIAIATILASLLDVRVVFAKKTEHVNTTDDKYVAEAYSFTQKKMNKVFVSKPFLSSDDKILIVDDFLADGQAARALIDITNKAGAQIVGIGAVIEKGQQHGGDRLREEGYRVESIVVTDSMNSDSNTVTFREMSQKVADEGIQMSDHDYMQMAIEEAREGIRQGHGGPFGSVIVKDGKVVARGHNMVLKNNDPTAHGEMTAIRKAGEALNTFDLSGCTLYTTGEPCHMCLCAIMWANIEKVYYGCTIADNGRIGFRDDKFNDIFGGRDRLGQFLAEIDRDKCLELFDEYNNMQHQGY